MGLATHQASSALLRVFAGETVSPPPIWLMRQAGRYLPEYRAIRAKVGSFLDLCYNPALAAEVALQPIRRFGFDAAIVFSDILVVPDALGQEVVFVEGDGPRLKPIRSESELAQLKPAKARKKFGRVFEAVTRLKQGLASGRAVIGFCGAPWTVATYMVSGRASDHAEARLWAYRDPPGFQRLVDLLVEVSVDFLSGQIAAGADVVQIFDSWAGVLADDQFRRWVIAPTKAIVAEIKGRHPHVPVIGFPRGAGSNSAAYVVETGADGIGCDSSMALEFIARELSGRAVVQGNLDPVALVAGGVALEERVSALLAALGQHPYIFNLGHGVLPDTPPENVARLVALVRGEGRR
jgi:uroporphyrinogen decarboxylase